jgi:hypothetical protein
LKQNLLTGAIASTAHLNRTAIFRINAIAFYHLSSLYQMTLLSDMKMIL